MDISNKAFWEKLSHTFAETTKLLYEKASEHGIELDAVMAEDMVDYKNQLQHELLEVEAHALTKLATKYTHTARKLYDTIHKENLSLQKIETEINLGIKDEAAAESDADEYIDCMDIINWYLFQIQVKFMRAISGTLRNSFDFDVDEEDVDDDGRPFIKDSDGSAKVALIGADRSMMAWRKMMDGYLKKNRGPLFYWHYYKK